MKNAKKPISIYLITLFAFLCLASTTRAIALFTSFNHSTMHFDKGVMFNISAISVVVAIVLFLSFFFVAPKKFKLAPDCSALHSFIPSGILSVALLFMSFSMLFIYSSGETSNKGAAVFVHYIPLVLSVLAVLAAIFFFITTMLTKRVSTVKASFGICAVIFVALYGIFLYFTKEQPTNAPNKIIDEMAYFSAALFLLYETRLSLGRDLWKPYIAFGLIASLLTGYSAIPALILYFANGTIISNSINENVLTFALFIFISVKLLLTLKLPDDSQCKMANAIERLAARREEELAERRKASHARVYNNIEETDSAEDNSGDNSNEEDVLVSEGQISFELDTPDDQN